MRWLRPAGKPAVKAQATDKFWFVTHALVLLGCAVVYYLLGSKLIPLPQAQLDLLRRAAARDGSHRRRARDRRRRSRFTASGESRMLSTRFTLRRIEHLVVGILIALIGVSVIFRELVHRAHLGWRRLGHRRPVVQTPMTSFIGWIYILVRRPYRVGDRIKIDDATGDVIDVGYIDTTLWEFGGQLLSTDHPSGRIIKFPNAKVLDSIVYNYSWPLFPYIWNEIKFQIAYQSDLQFVADDHGADRRGRDRRGNDGTRGSLSRAARRKRRWMNWKCRAHPRVIFRVDEVTWIDAIVRYVVPPREAGSVKTRLIPKLLAALNAEPDKVMFPAGANR